MNLDWQTAERMVCSTEDRRAVVPLIDAIVKAAEQARTSGLLSLERNLDGLEDELLRLGLQLVVDGTDPEIIRDLLTTRVLSSNQKGKRLVEQLIIVDGVLSIQAGDNPRIIEARCFAFLGEDASQLHAAYASGVVAGRGAAAVDEFMKTDGQVSECFADSRTLLVRDDRSIQNMLREVDMKQLAAAMDGMDHEVRAKILRNMSRRAAVLLVTGEMVAEPDPISTSRNIGLLREIANER